MIGTRALHACPQVLAAGGTTALGASTFAFNLAHFFLSGGVGLLLALAVYDAHNDARDHARTVAMTVMVASACPAGHVEPRA